MHPIYSAYTSLENPNAVLVLFIRKFLSELKLNFLANPQTKAESYIYTSRALKSFAVYQKYTTLSKVTIY